MLSSGLTPDTRMEDAEDVSENSPDKERLSGRIHILGLGNVGSFVAHSLASKRSRPPMTLLLHTPDMYQTWLGVGQHISINSRGIDDYKTGFDINVFDKHTWYSIPYLDSRKNTQQSLDDDIEDNHDLNGITNNLDYSLKDDEVIECLIVTVKAHRTLVALKSVSHRLTPESTVLLIQNGMGALEEVKEEVFPDESQRPNLMLGIFSHGLNRMSPFKIWHTGVGTTILSPVWCRNAYMLNETTYDDWAPSTKYLLRTLTLAPPLVAVSENPTNLLLLQLEKLAVNCVINPLTAVLDCENGELLNRPSVSRSMHLLFMEISAVISSMPELRSIPGIGLRFSPDRLKQLAMGIASRTANNTSSMRQDLRFGNQTEIDYLNGYIIRRGEELGIKCAVNYLVMQMLLAKQSILEGREEQAIPLVEEEMDQFD